MAKYTSPCPVCSATAESNVSQQHADQLMSKHWNKEHVKG